MSILTIQTHFITNELQCGCGCGKMVTDILLLRLECLRSLVGSPLTISSGARCPAHNKIVGGKSNSKHLEGIAVDISCVSDKQRYIIIEAAPHLGFYGIGVANNYVHLDLRAELDKASWLY